jgi:hypothetical protein
MTALYASVMQPLRNAKLICHNKKIISITPQHDECTYDFPCEGHMGIRIHFTDKTNVSLTCSTIEIGAIMWYFNIQNEHFTKYIDNDFQMYILANLK